MKKLIIVFLLMLAIRQAPAQDRKHLVGSWTLVFVDNILPDGSRVHLYGSNPHGILVFDIHGNYSLQIMSSDRSKFEAKDKSKGTAEENRIAIQGINTHFGTYEVNDSDSTLTFRVEHASYPNWEGTVQTRKYKLNGIELKYIVPAPTTGTAVTGEVKWRRTR